MFELSPLLTAANACASSMPAVSSVSRSKPIPATVLPSKLDPSLLKDVAAWSMTATE